MNPRPPDLSPYHCAVPSGTDDPMEGPTMYLSTTAALTGDELRRPRPTDRKPRPGRSGARRRAIAANQGEQA